MLNRILINRHEKEAYCRWHVDVYRAHDKLLDRFVAIKNVTSAIRNDSDFKTRFT